ncbi:hypothetical protein NEIELOOT_01086 [Neisseria elongata subsp. glycolytica ATCC 29315]|uniref:Uncharacterized protein n=1 Tax=Neisseria elongata subsp. glycolytica ATCC 29315 TaxID=546263 RepID=D4DPV0_NEIEG|nr:hypothetical protein NEIELOOT_01086 [Neisseria elongata subsp. glycolytica ATCC 29315]
MGKIRSGKGRMIPENGADDGRRRFCGTKTKPLWGKCLSDGLISEKRVKSFFLISGD